MSTPANRQGYGPGIHQDLGGNVAFNVVTVVYGVAPVFDVSLGRYFQVTPTDAVAFAIAAPTNPHVGAEFVLRIINTTGGALGALTFNAVFKLAAAALTQPADTFSRSYRFFFDGTNWIEQGARTVDVAN